MKRRAKKEIACKNDSQSSTTKMQTRFPATVAFSILCLAGFTVQVYDISDKYFKYLTSTSTKITLPDHLNTSSVSLCIRYSDLVPLPSGQPSFLLSTAEGFAFFSNLTQSLTVAQIFEATPAGNESLVVQCLYRRPHSYRIFEGNRETCLSLFPVTKYYMMESICYAFISADSLLHEPFVYQNLAFSLRYPGLFFHLVLNKTVLKGANFMKAIVHGPLLPIDSFASAPSLYRVVDKIEKYNKIQAGYSKLNVHLLPPPYATRCDLYPIHNGSQKQCVNVCIDAAVQHSLKKVPFNVPRTKAIDMQPINTKQVQNVTFSRILDRMEEKCETKCGRTACLDSYYTTILQKEEKDEFGQISLQVYAPTAAAVSVKHTESLTLTDFIVYFTSCFGTWFGLSALSFKPSNWASLFKKWAGKEASSDCCCPVCSRLSSFLKQQVSLLRSQLNRRQSFIR